MKMVDCVSVSVSVFADAMPHRYSFALRASDFALRATTGQDEGTWQANMLKHPFMHTIIIRLTKADFVVNINFLRPG
jgi:hypothetical protein